jgi:hypothetical protein
MRVVIVSLVLLFATCGPIFSQTPSTTDEVAPPAGFGSIAPADEYFGRLKMSVLGIRNELLQLESKIDAAPYAGDSIMSTAALVEDALHDWQNHYPGDPWLAKSVYQLEHMYAKVRSEAGHRSAMRVLSWLIASYSNTPYPQEALDDVAKSLSQPIVAPAAAAVPPHR